MAQVYKNADTKPARFLTLMVPAGLERFFEEVGKPPTDPPSSPLFEKEDLEKFLAAAPRYGVEILSFEPQLDVKAITGDPVNRDNRAGAPKDPGPVVLVTADYFILPNTRTWFALSQ